MESTHFIGLRIPLRSADRGGIFGLHKKKQGEVMLLLILITAVVSANAEDRFITLFLPGLSLKDSLGSFSLGSFSLGSLSSFKVVWSKLGEKSFIVHYQS